MLRRGARLSTRSPFLAGTLSAFVPGAGRLYTGRLGDALASLFTVGLTGWQAYDGFRRDGISSAKGWDTRVRSVASSMSVTSTVL